ncbi:thioredoxin domain-containing protein [Streptomyces sp. CA-278952]|uniref:DsbA family protein n=1 Tax=unclassified Streptomyces TaxID=2593676 RepID=UPI0022429796|nr:MULTISPECIES: thioredoxin domain-containing protein [unclassified Streptomyces]UZI32677.1 DsbA family protein [Streptomyces sp. VB1]WDG32608.1 thioredoxin domain-containing protein [Streptomyces sp. CA-278952]
MDSTDGAVKDMVMRRHRRRRTLIGATVAVVVVGGAALVGVGLVRAENTAPDQVPSRVPAQASSDKAGLALSSSGKVRVDLYLDYLCPSCRNTEKALAAGIEELTEGGGVRVVYHPVAFLDDRSDPPGYSSRAASAAACAADHDRFEAYSALLFERQPRENSPGLSEADLTAAGKEAGISDQAFAKCVRGDDYTPWTSYVTDFAASKGVAVTPTVMVDGERVDVTGSDPAGALMRAVAEAAE